MTEQQLKEYDYILMMDKSSSMGTKDVNGKSRWDAGRETVVGIARKCAEYDTDGITVIPFAANFKSYDNITGGEDQVAKIYTENEPNGSTDTAKVFKHVFEDYFTRKAAGKAKPMIIICVTDGTPDDKPALANVIIEATKKMNADEEIGIQFLQIGKDPGAAEYLKTLDDDLVKQGAKFDIVDTKTLEEVGEMSIVDVFIAALTD